MSNTYNTNLIWFNKNFYSLGPNDDFYEFGLCHPEYKYPIKWPRQTPAKWKKALIKNYYNSKKYKNNPSKRDVASLRWYWD